MSSSALVTKRNPVASNAWRSGRVWVSNGRGPLDSITDHVTEGSAASVRDWFARTRERPTSAHYMVPIAAGVELFVDEDDTAYHAGELVAPTHPVVIERYANGHYSPNSYAIGIEHEGDGEHELVGDQRARAIRLHADICARRDIAIDRRHIFGHHEVKTSKTCPGKISVDRLVADVLAFAGTGTVPSTATTPARAPDVATIPAVVYSPSLGALVPITVTSDTVWTFSPVAELRAAVKAGRVARTYEAGSPLSAFPRVPKS